MRLADPEIQANAALLVDRALPLGNSLDTFARRALHVKIGNKETEAIPVFVTDSAGGTEVFLDAFDEATTPGAEQTLLSSVVPALTARKLHSVDVSCRAEGQWRLEADGEVVASGRTCAAAPNDRFIFQVPRAIAPGVALELIFKARAGSAVNGVDAHLAAVDNAS